jgi:uncharacterized protein (DUF2237 family)
LGETPKKQILSYVQNGAKKSGEKRLAWHRQQNKTSHKSTAYTFSSGYLLHISSHDVFVYWQPDGRRCFCSGEFVQRCGAGLEADVDGEEPGGEEVEEVVQAVSVRDAVDCGVEGGKEGQDIRYEACSVWLSVGMLGLIGLQEME